ncbi:uncharacterized protein LOC135691680 isoform X1 [Rhopilema esculentum]|uniref:uncharacterized protein LOC135691680 isoform X1 n=2 Tax=Rhopilema esculentum TaxID=499914 RepID=UPI0031E08991
MDDVSQLDQSDSKEDESCIVDNRQQSILSFFKPVTQNLPQCINVKETGILSDKNKTCESQRSTKINIEDTCISNEIDRKEKSKQCKKHKRKSKSGQSFDNLHNCIDEDIVTKGSIEVEGIESNELPCESIDLNDSESKEEYKGGRKKRRQGQSKCSKNDKPVLSNQESIKISGDDNLENNKMENLTDSSCVNQIQECAEENDSLEDKVVIEKSSDNGSTDIHCRVKEPEERIIPRNEELKADQSLGCENEMKLKVCSEGKMDVNSDDEDGQNFHIKNKSVNRNKPKKKRRKIIDSDSDGENENQHGELMTKNSALVELSTSSGSRECGESSKIDEVGVRRSTRVKQKEVSYCHDEFADEDKEDEHEKTIKKVRRSESKEKADETHEKKPKRKNKQKNIDNHSTSTGDNPEECCQTSVLDMCSSKRVPIPKGPEETQQNVKIIDSKLVEKCLNAPESSVMKTNFLSKFSNQKFVRHEDTVILESETCLPTTSHVLQISDAENTWYKSLPMASKVGKILLGDTELMNSYHPVPDTSIWTCLLTMNKTVIKKMEVTSAKSVSLAVCLGAIMTRKRGFPILEVLEAYLYCQKSVLQQCLAKAELMRSNLKMIWEKQGKIEPIAPVGVSIPQSETICTTTPAVDIRNMFKKAKTLKPTAKDGDADITSCKQLITENASKGNRNSSSRKGKKSQVQDKAVAVTKVDKAEKKSKKNDKTRTKNKSAHLDLSVELIESPQAKLSGTIKQSFAKVSKHPRQKELEDIKKASKSKDEKGHEKGDDSNDSSTRRRSGRKIEKKDYKESVTNFDPDEDRLEITIKEDKHETLSSTKNVDGPTIDAGVDYQDKVKDYCSKKKTKKKKRKHAKCLVDDTPAGTDMNIEDENVEGDSSKKAEEKKSRKKPKKQKKKEQNSEEKEKVEKKDENVDSKSSTPSNADIRKLFNDKRMSSKEKKDIEHKKEERKATVSDHSLNDSVIEVLPAVESYEVKSGEAETSVEKKQEIRLPCGLDIRKFFGQKSLNCSLEKPTPVFVGCKGEDDVTNSKSAECKPDSLGKAELTERCTVEESSICNENANEDKDACKADAGARKRGRRPKGNTRAGVLKKEGSVKVTNMPMDIVSTGQNKGATEIMCEAKNATDINCEVACSKTRNSEMNDEVSDKDFSPCEKRNAIIMLYFSSKKSVSSEAPTEESKELTTDRDLICARTLEKKPCDTDKLKEVTTEDDDKEVTTGEFSSTDHEKNDRLGLAQEKQRKKNEKLEEENCEQDKGKSPLLKSGDKSRKVDVESEHDICTNDEAATSDIKLEDITPRSKRKRDVEPSIDPSCAEADAASVTPPLQFATKKSKRQKFDENVILDGKQSAMKQDDNLVVREKDCPLVSLEGNSDDNEGCSNSGEHEGKLPEEIKEKELEFPCPILEKIDVSNVVQQSSHHLVDSNSNGSDSNDPVMALHRSNINCEAEPDNEGMNANETENHDSSAATNGDKPCVMEVDQPLEPVSNIKNSDLTEKSERNEKSNDKENPEQEKQDGKTSDDVNLSRSKRSREIKNELLEETGQLESDSGRRRSSRVKQKEEQRMIEEEERREELRLAREEQRRRKEELKLAKEENRRKDETLHKEIGEGDLCTSPLSKKRKRSPNASESKKETMESNDMPNDVSLEILEPVESSTTNSSSKDMTTESADNHQDSRKDFEVQPVTEDFVNSTLLWTEKYAPMKHEQVIGNASHCNELFDWLSSWKEKHEHLVMQMMASKAHRPRAKNDDDHSDFEDSDEEDNLSNTYLIIGETGCGSTAAVYACAQELGYKVLEMNPSSHRSGKQIQALLGEATQSHQVKRKFHGSANESGKGADGTKGFLPFFGAKAEGKTEEENNSQSSEKETEKGSEESESSKEQSEQSGGSGDMSLILFEQADVVFDEQDRGFWFGVNELRKEAKRPIIITANDPLVSCKLDGGSYSLLTMEAVDYETIANHLEAICLAEQVMPQRELIRDVIAKCNGDIRKSLLKLQFLLEQWQNPCHEALSKSISKLMGQDDIKEALPVVDSFSEMKPVVVTEELVPREGRGMVTGSAANQEVKANSNCKEPCSELDNIIVDIKCEVVEDEEAQNLGPEIYDCQVEDLPGPNAVEKEETGAENAESKSEDRLEELDAFIAMVHETEDSTVKETGNALFDITQVTEEELLASKSKQSFWSLGQCTRGVKNESETCRSLRKIASSAELVSSVDMRGIPDHLSLRDSLQSHGWWHGRIVDGITDEERFSFGSGNAYISNQLFSKVQDAYKEIHEAVLNRDGVCCSSADIQARDTKSVFKSVENLLPCSGRSDHGALCVDILPTLSTICKSEEHRKHTQFGRRSRRFLHYLDTIGFHLEPELQEKFVRTWVGKTNYRYKWC